MDLEEKNTENPAVFRQSLSIDRASSGRSSRRSSSYSYVFPRHIDDGDDDNESKSVSEAGDIGDRALHRNSSSSNRFRLSLDHVGERSAVVLPILDDSSFRSKGNIADIRDATVQSLDVKHRRQHSVYFELFIYIYIYSFRSWI